jgi:hypothetical protein
MRTFLMIAGLAGLLASSSAAFAADGPGRSVPNSADRNQTVFANNDRSDDWNRDNNRPWQNRQQHNGPSQHWQGWGHDGFNGGYPISSIGCCRSRPSGPVSSISSFMI